MLGPFRCHRHALAGDINLVGDEIGDACVRRLVHKFNFRFIAEQAFGQNLGHVYIVACHVALFVAEVPRRIGKPRSNNDFAARQDILKLARHRRVAKSRCQCCGTQACQ